MPDDSTPTSPAQTPVDETARQGDQSMEWRHFRFAMIVMFTCVLGLPVLGALAVLMVRWGWLPSPIPQ
jgi:hypothetical protein